MARGIAWQEGYGTFSYAHSQINNVYLNNLKQIEHQVKQKFKGEYLNFSQKFKIEYNEKHIFNWIE
jgi:putative transposase